MEDSIASLRQESSVRDKRTMGGMSIIRADNAAREERVNQDMEDIKKLLKVALTSSQKQPRTSQHESFPGSPIEARPHTERMTDEGAGSEERKDFRPWEDTYTGYFLPRKKRQTHSNE